MLRKGGSDEEIIYAHQVEGGEKVAEVCRRLGVSEQTFYRWKKQFTGLGLSELRELQFAGRASKTQQIIESPARVAGGAQRSIRSVGR